LLKIAAVAFAAAVFFLFTAIVQMRNYNPVDALVKGYEQPRLKSRGILQSARNLGTIIARAPVMRDLVMTDRIERQLYLAGYGISVQEWFGIWALSAGLGSFFGLVLWGMRLPVLFALVCPLLGIFIPKALLDGRSARVLLAAGIEFISFIEKTSLLCGAGVAITAAFKSCISDTFLGREIGIMEQDIDNGKPLEMGIDSFAKNTGLPEAEALAMAVKNAMQYGQGRLPGALKKLVEDIRHTRESRVEEISRKMESKLILPVVGSIMPAVFLAVIGPIAVIMLHALM
jgi:tight adherence protein C